MKTFTPEVLNPNRSDVLLERAAEALCERFGLNWKSGLGEVAREVIRENAPRVDLSPQREHRAYAECVAEVGSQRKVVLAHLMWMYLWIGSTCCGDACGVHLLVSEAVEGC